MPQIVPKNSTLLRFYLDDVAIGFATDQSLSFAKDLPEFTNKDSAGYKESMSGTKSSSGSSSLFYVDNLTSIYAAYNGDEPVTMKLSNELSGEEYFEGEAHISEMTINPSGQNQPTTATLSFEFTGAFSRATHA